MTAIHNVMERRRFDNWLDSRQNIIGETWWDNLLGRAPRRPTPPAAPGAAPTPGHPAADYGAGPTEPEQVYRHPTVDKYFREVVSHLLLDRNLEVVDGAGNKRGDYNGTLPDEMERALRRFVGAHVLGGQQSFLRINQHDAILILNFLDRLRVPGEEAPLTDRFGLHNPQALTHWMESKVPVSPNIMRQQGFSHASAAYVPNRERGAGSLRDPRVRHLVDSAVKVINGVQGQYDTKRRSITKPIIDSVKEMRAALENLGILSGEPEPAPEEDDGSGGPPAGGGTPPPGDPDIRGRGRARKRP